MKKIIIFLIIISVISFTLYQVYFKKAETEFTLAKAERGDIFQEVSETGQVKKGDKINLSFKSTGVIEGIYVEVGEQVQEKEILAKLENNQLKIKLREAKAKLELSQAELDKLLSGATPEEIQIAQTAVNNAKISLLINQQTLKDKKAQGEDNLKSAYEDSLNALDDAYIKISNAKNTADLIQTTYFTVNDQEGVKIRENKDKIQNALTQIKPYLDIAEASNENEDIDTALFEMGKKLNEVSDALRTIRDTCEAINYKNAVSSSDKSSLDTQREYINTTLTNIVNSQQTISSTKLTNSLNINTYQGEIDSAQGDLNTAEDKLSQLIAPPRKEDVDLYQAQVKQAEAQVQLLEEQFEDVLLKSPINGQIIKVEKRVGELVQSALGDTIVSILPAIPFEIEVDIYEEDVVKINIGNQVNIFLVAFPEQTFEGKVISIEPAEKLIEGVVYYQATIAFEKLPEGVKPGMTADLIIKTAERENVLIIPEDAIQKKDGKKFVEVLVGEKPEEREVETGLLGSNDMIEIISGVNEEDQVIIR